MDALLAKYSPANFVKTFTSLQIEGDHVNFSHNECNTVAKESVCHRCWKSPPSPLSSPNLSN